MRRHERRSESYPTRWSEWEWNEQYQRDVRYREVCKGKWEWEYAETRAKDVSDSPVKPTPWSPSDRSPDPHGALLTISEQSEQDEEPGGAPAKHDSVESAFSTRFHEDMREGKPWAAKDCVSIEIEQFDRMTLGIEADPESSTAGTNWTDESATYARVDTETDGKGKEILCPICSMGFSRGSDLERHHKTVHLKEGARPYHCPFDNCSANVKSWTTAAKLRLHIKTWHSDDPDTDKPATQQITLPTSPTEVHQYYDDHFDPDDQYGNYHQYPEYPPTKHQPFEFQPADSQLVHYLVKDSSTSKDKLDPRFKVHRSSDFEFGRVFKVLWSEPAGAGGTEITEQNVQNTKFGEKAYHKVRRFIVMRSDRGHSICIPILTYGYQGVLKPGVHPETHTVVYSNPRDGPRFLKGEKKLIRKKPIKIDIKDPSEKLDPISRLNYAKIYTVEHNVKVLFIGKVADNYEHEVVMAFNETHPPLSSTSYSDRPDSPDMYTMNAQGHDPTYPNATPVPTSSTSYPGWGASQYTSSYAASATCPGPAAQPYNISYNSRPEMTPAAKDDHDPSYEDGYELYDDGYEV
ncbi:hypothetical protein L207DRAFT_576419 [Hyaloscypha variabilis F]|uniref:C2H2-type domain-containing protein n=1 Tax=Hyaloscypha variabilis (strain UAMH 11265 / GT02V1 / F) TaxID=1149755 RepID=A0A2J6SA63_HYAVF|nr:hypothetical protein L207DRAFT_576419 [Hyaloscypha variabilis F]